MDNNARINTPMPIQHWSMKVYAYLKLEDRWRFRGCCTQTLDYYSEAVECGFVGTAGTFDRLKNETAATNGGEIDPSTTNRRWFPVRRRAVLRANKLPPIAVRFDFDELFRNGCTLISALDNTLRVHDGFGFNIRQLRAVEFHTDPGARQVSIMGRDSFSDCRNMSSFDARGLSALTTVGSNWLFRATCLISFNAKGLGALKTVEQGWLAGADSLTSFSTEGLTSLRSVGDCWLLVATQLASFDAEGLTSLRTVGNDWLGSATALTSFNSDGLTALHTVGNGWLYNAKALTSFSTEGLTALTTVGNDWLYGATALTAFNLEGLTALQKVGTRWLNDVRTVRFDKRECLGSAVASELPGV